MVGGAHLRPAHSLLTLPVRSSNASLPSLLLLFTFSKPERVRLPVSAPLPLPVSSGLLDVTEKVGAEVSVGLAAGALTGRGLGGLHADGNHIGGRGKVAVGPAGHLPLWHDVVDGCEEEEEVRRCREIWATNEDKQERKAQLLTFGSTLAVPPECQIKVKPLQCSSLKNQTEDQGGRLLVWSFYETENICSDGRLQESQSVRNELPGRVKWKLHVLSVFRALRTL